MMDEASHSARRPPTVLCYGLLGLIPFLAPPAIAWAFPALSDLARTVLIVYGAVILSFLGGARWGLALHAATPRVATLSLAMLPSIVALVLVAAPGLTVGWRLGGLALALVAHAVWDVTAPDLPGWYPSLRLPLTAGAVLGLCLGILL